MSFESETFHSNPFHFDLRTLKPRKCNQTSGNEINSHNNSIKETVLEFVIGDLNLPVNTQQYYFHELPKTRTVVSFRQHGKKGKHPLLGLLINSVLSDVNRVTKLKNRNIPSNSLDYAATDRLEFNCIDKENLIWMLF